MTNYEWVKSLSKDKMAIFLFALERTLRENDTREEDVLSSTIKWLDAEHKED